MNTGMAVVVFVIMCSYVLFIVLSIPLIQRRVKPNRLYGLRVPATFADEWVWYEANARSGRDLLYLGVAGLIAAVALAIWPHISLINYAIAHGIIAAGGAVMCAITGTVRANRLLEERRMNAS